MSIVSLRKEEMEMEIVKTPPAIAVLVATYNGAANLQKQLDSFCNQTLMPKVILISDDGSTDDTREISQRFSDLNPELSVCLLQGPHKGVANNFLYLLNQVPDYIDMVFLSDQDDIWFSEKLARGATMLEGQEGVALYCGRTLEWDAKQNQRRLSRLPVKPPSFQHAIVQNIAGGNTMVLNRAALELVQATSKEVGQIVMHDWWIYQIVTAIGGAVIFDPEPMMLYRQHPDNLIGANWGVLPKIRRLWMMLTGRFRSWGTINIKALKASQHRMTVENAQRLDAFSQGRNGSVLERLRMIRDNGFYRQGRAGQISLYVAALLKRV